MVLPLSGAVAVVQAIIGVAIQLSTRSSGALIDDSNPDNPQLYWHRILTSLGGGLGGSLISAVFAAVLTGMLIVVVTEDVVGRRVGFELVWNKVRSRIWRLVGLSIVVGVLEFAGLLLCLAPGIWLWGIWAVAVPALMVENRSLGGSLGRSRRLVEGMFWRVWGIRALGYLIAGLISTGVGLAFGVIGLAANADQAGGVGFSNGVYDPSSLSAGTIILLGIGSAVAALLAAPIKAGIDSLLYVDQRMRKENLAIDLQAAAARR